MRADDLRELADELLASDKAWDSSPCGRPYYHVGDREVSVTRSFMGAARGRYVAFDLLEDGRVMGWFDRTCYDLTDDAAGMAERVTEWCA